MDDERATSDAAAADDDNDNDDGDGGGHKDADAAADAAAKLDEGAALMAIGEKCECCLIGCACPGVTGFILFWLNSFHTDRQKPQPFTFSFSTSSSV